MALNTRPIEENTTDPAEISAAATSDTLNRIRHRYFSKSDLAKGGVLDFRYYTKTALDALLTAYTNTATLVTTLAGYALLAGRAGGQTLRGGTAAGDDLTLMSTANATKGNINFGTSTYDEVNNRLGIGRTPTASAAEVAGVVEARYASDQRYALGMQPLNGFAVLYAYDYTGAAYIPQVIDGQTIALRPGGDDAKALAVDASGNVSIAGRVGTAWAALTLNSGGNWANYGGSYYGAAYKRVGDLVFLRGLVVRTSGSDTLIATLPSGYRPGSYSLHATAGDDVFARIDLETDGEMRLQAGSATAYLSLDGIVFSIA